MDGAVYEWRVATMRRERENVLKVSLADYKTIFQGTTAMPDSTALTPG